jgi:MSHA biogenesis protein MshM
VTDTQIVVRRTDNSRRTIGIAVAGIAAGLLGGLGIARFMAPGNPAAPATTPRMEAVAAVPATASPAPASPAPASPIATSVPGPAPITPRAQPAAQAVLPAPAAIPVSATTILPAKGAGNEGVDKRLAAGQSLLESGGKRQTVQLLVAEARSRAYLDAYLAEAARAVDAQQLYVVPSGSPEAPRFGVLYGAYDNRVQAIAALDALPPALRQFKPYVRPLDAVRDEARRAERR